MHDLARHQVVKMLLLAFLLAAQPLSVTSSGMSIAMADDDGGGDDGGGDDGGSDDGGGDDGGSDDGGGDDGGSDGGGGDDGGDSRGGHDGGVSGEGDAFSSRWRAEDDERHEQDDKGQDNEDHERALRARRSGSVPPLKDILEQIRRNHGGTVLDVRLQRRNGRVRYHIRLLDRHNRLRNLYVQSSHNGSKQFNFNTRKQK